jgi:hypothetical protein
MGNPLDLTTMMGTQTSLVQQEKSLAILVRKEEELNY